MEIENIEIESPVVLASLTIVPISRSSLRSRHWNRKFFFVATKKPIGVLVISNETRKAFRINGEEVSLDQLIQEFPSLKEKLERF